MAEPESVASSQLAQFVGSWRLIAFEGEVQGSSERRPIFGASPKGRFIVLQSGVLIVVITGGERKPPKSAEERASAFNSTVAYTGRVSVAGDRLTTHVDASWNEAWVGTEQVRAFRFIGARLELATD